MAIGDILYFSPDVSMAYNPIALEELPEFVQEELDRYVVKLYGFVYKGIWNGENAYLVWSDGFQVENTESCGHFYLEDGTDLGAKTEVDFIKCSGGWDKWTCVYFWKYWRL
ncbi:MAG: hypothetical protein NC127_04910 [Muribaculum sp.]|nr:hypothetical protein [Muribaculum sp.]